MAAISIADLREQARRKLPRSIFDYIEGGSGDETTLAANRAAFGKVSLVPRFMRDVSNISQRTTILGRPTESPLILAPVGLAGLFARNGEMAAARAAHAQGVPAALSTTSINSVEDVAGASASPPWFQLYVMRDRGLTKALVERARAAGCPALMLTIDVPVQGPRERDIRNGLTVPPRITWRNAFDMVQRLPWILDVMLGPPPIFGNFQKKGETIVAGAATVMKVFDPSVTWADFEWFRTLWDGPIVIKGIMDPDNAKRAADLGAAAIVVSNHGGRQLDGAPSPLTVLSAISDAVADRLEIYADSGIRRGSDVVKYLASGARACLVGRAYAYGLAAGGESGVTDAIQILKREIATALTLLGVTDVTRLDRSALLMHPPAG